MALILGVRKGSRIYLGDEPLDVLSTHGYQRIVVSVNGKQFNITPFESMEVMPQVFVSSGMPKKPKENRYTRLVFDAPAEVTILRSELYETCRV